MRGKEHAKDKDWRTYVKLAQAGDKPAKEWLINENSGLIYMVLNRFSGHGYDKEELYQIGAIGLLRAVERFDLDTDYAFSTYAVPMIIGEIQRFLRDDGLIHVSRTMKEHARKIAAFREKWGKENCSDPTIQEVSQGTGLTREEIVTAMEASAAVESIDQPVLCHNSKMEQNHMTLGDQIVDERCSDSAIINHLTIRQMLEGLTEQERLLIRLRYMEGKTQSEVAKLMDMNQVAVSRFEKKILLSLRRKYES